MDGFPRFRPGGNQFLISGATTTPSATNSGPGPSEGATDYFIYNQGANDGWVGYGMSSDAAVSNSSIPIIGVSSAAVQCPAQAFFILRLAPNLFFAARTQLGSTNIFITPGNGQ